MKKKHTISYKEMINNHKLDKFSRRCPVCLEIINGEEHECKGNSPKQSL